MVPNRSTRHLFELRLPRGYFVPGVLPEFIIGINFCRHRNSLKTSESLIDLNLFTSCLVKLVETYLYLSIKHSCSSLLKLILVEVLTIALVTDIQQSHRDFFKIFLRFFFIIKKGT